ncbi:MAG: energy transducer TonB [Prolixibacteraceae bacterium]
MKTRAIFLLCMIFSFIAIGQDQKGLSGATITPPKFTGFPGAIPIFVEQKFKSIDEYMAMHVKYPDYAVTHYISGTEVIGFSVSPQGEVVNIKVINSLSSAVDDEVISVLKTTSGMWKPGYINDEAIAMDKEISVVFKFQEQSLKEFKERAKTYYSRACENLLMKQNPKQALKYFDKGMKLLPKDKSLLALRGLTRYELGDKDGALSDWTRIKNLGGGEGDAYIEQFITMRGYQDILISMKGYEVMSEFLSQ